MTEFVRQTGKKNPFAGIDVTSNSTPTFVDVDDDGDLVIGEDDERLIYFKSHSQPLRIPLRVPTAPTYSPHRSDDEIQGLGDNDTLEGDDGNDILTGGVGADTFMFNPDIFDSDAAIAALRGGSGADDFMFIIANTSVSVFNPGADVVTDFEDDVDTV